MKLSLLFKGPVLTVSGYGVHARQILNYLLKTEYFDISVKPINWGNTSILHGGDFVEKVNQLNHKFMVETQGQNPPKQYDVSVQVTIPNEFERIARTNIGITAGIETNACSPVWIKKINEDIDYVFVPSQHSKNVLENTGYKDEHGNVLKLNKPVFLAHEGFNKSVFNLDPNEKELFEFESDFNFLFVGLGINREFGNDRKNIPNMVKWFCETFKGNKNVGLVLKTAVVNNSLMDFEMTKDVVRGIKKGTGCGEYPKITVVHGRLSDEELGNLYKNPKIKAFVTATSGEGFGLPLLEAAACGLPVMATNWSGHLDFLKIGDEKTFVPLDYELKQVPESAVWQGVIEQHSQWAYVKEEDIKLKMKKVVASYNQPKEWAKNLAKHIHENFEENHVTSKLFENIVRVVHSHRKQNPTTANEVIDIVKSSFTKEDEGKKLLYTMPMSAGDVYISTAVIDGLKKKHPDHKIFFATQQPYLSILKDNPNIHKVIPWNDWMTTVPMCEQIFDEVYTPNLAVQMTFSNWVHGGKGRKLAEEMAVNCNVELGDYHIEIEKPEKELPEKYIVFNPGSGKGQWEARNYVYWQEVVSNLARELGDVKIVQTGLEGDPEYKDVVDFRGATKNFNQLAYVIKNADLVLGIDSVTMHMAAGLKVNHVALFGSSYAGSTGPTLPVLSNKQSILLETQDRYGCDKACYQYTCRENREHPCINEIEPREIYAQTLMAIYSSQSAPISKDALLNRYEEYNPKISGYTHVYNAETGNYPYIESIKSMLGFCDEVVVVDGGSTDGTVEKIQAIDSDKVKIHVREWDWNEPGMDGMQKAYGRAMCSGEFLWQQDTDEVVHEDDYNKIKKLAKRFPKDVDILHLPVIELWGESDNVRTDRHSWKWRLSRNDFRITHGIQKDARMVDEETGKVYSKKGMSDGCFYIDIMTNEMLPHKGFYNGELDYLRQTDPKSYGERMNQIFNELPSVFHYSWANIPRKIKNFKQTWDSMWNNLYNEKEKIERFPEVRDENDVENIEKVAKDLFERGGEHEGAPTFKLNKTNPAVMKEWLNG